MSASMKWTKQLSFYLCFLTLRSEVELLSFSVAQDTKVCFWDASCTVQCSTYFGAFFLDCYSSCVYP